jgi:predicted kinase
MKTTNRGETMAIKDYSFELKVLQEAELAAAAAAKKMIDEFPEWFQEFLSALEASDVGQQMKQTIEGSEWHREESVWVHTMMCLEHYWQNVAQHRTERERDLTLLSLACHDLGKPEAEETVERKDGSGTTYHRYAGHEPVSANEFISFVCDHEALMKKFFARGFGWDEIRKIKFMIEHHLPFGLKNKTKRQNLRNTVEETLGWAEQCFYDQLWSDCCGRISDNHDEKKANVVQWIEEFRAMPTTATKEPKASAPVMYVLCGTVGAGKSTWMTRFQRLNQGETMVVVSEDVYRVHFFKMCAEPAVLNAWMRKDKKSQYAEAWQFCFDRSKEYDKYAKDELHDAVESGCTLILDRTNQTRKSRGPWITAAKSKGYKIIAVEFYISEQVMHARQKSRPEKDVPYHRARQIFMAMETPWFPIEVDEYEIVPPWN